MAEAATPSVAMTDERRRTVDRVFRGALVFNVALTAYWLFLLATGGSSAFFRNSRAGLEQVAEVGLGRERSDAEDDEGGRARGGTREETHDLIL